MTDLEARASGRRGRAVVTLLLVLLVLAGLLALYVFAALSWSYADGERAGIVQKFSRKGWVCKTWEGELAQFVVPGVAPTIWYFTVRDDAVAREVNAAVGKKAVLHYEEHRGVPTRCFGDTTYFVDHVRVVE
jgi:hypothetical protein